MRNDHSKIKEQMRQERLKFQDNIIPVPVLKLFSLYDEKEPLPVPKGRNAVRKLSAAAIYIHLQRKMAIQNGDSGKEVKTNYLPFALPVALRKHYEYLQGLAVESENNFDMANSLENDFKVVIICNTFSTANDYYSKVILIKLINIIQGASKCTLFSAMCVQIFTKLLL